MATDFSRTLSLLRQEAGISQRKAAAALGISQALLSHYENGIREPGLAFVTRVCDFYHVSADYLLGRTASRDGSIIEAAELYDASDEKGTLKGSILATLQKKLVVNTTGVLFELLGKTGDREAITAAGDYLGDALYQLLRQLYREKAELLAESRQSSRRQLDTFSLWTHQIKVPISAMKLLLQDRPDAASATLLCELFKVEQYADMALNYARMNASSTDYVLRTCDLDALLRKVLRRFAPLFIEKKLRLCYEPAPYSLLTDEKWFSFAVEQLLSNAVKYTKAGSVTVAVDAEKQLLTISDTGVGIAPEDLPRVFEQGYTGENGRAHQRATGLGLYLCREALTRLGHSVRLESVPGQGTTAFVGLEREERAYE